MAGESTGAATPPTTAETIARANVANILRKLKAGKTLTKSDQSALDALAQPDESSTKELAARWRLDLRAAQRMKAAGVPLHDDAAMVRWFIKLPPDTQRKLTPEFTRTIRAINAGDVSEGEGGDVEWQKFLQMVGDNGTPDHRKQVRALETFRDGYAYKLSRANERGDQAQINFYNRLLVETSQAIKHEKLIALKLGIDEGDLYSASDVDRLGRAVAFWLMHGADMMITQISAALAASGIERETVRRAIDPLVLDARVLAPMVRACQVNAPIALPERFVDSFREALASIAEDGAGEFARLYSMPPPLPKVDDKSPVIQFPPANAAQT